MCSHIYSTTHNGPAASAGQRLPPGGDHGLAVVHAYVVGEALAVREALGAESAREGGGTPGGGVGVLALVAAQVAAVAEEPAALGARKGPLARVLAHVRLHVHLVVGCVRARPAHVHARRRRRRRRRPRLRLRDYRHSPVRHLPRPDVRSGGLSWNERSTAVEKSVHNYHLETEKQQRGLGNKCGCKAFWSMLNERGGVGQHL